MPTTTSSAAGSAPVTAADPRFPIGRWKAPEQVSAAERARWIEEVADAPRLLRAAIAGLDDAQLDTPYRDGGWTVRQVVHHVPDSHVNAYVRFKLALTEHEPTIKPYDEARWAELPDSRAPIVNSLALLDAIHVRWVQLLRSFGDAEWARTYVHPEHGTTFRLDVVLGLYAWHGRHHAAHVTSLRSRNGW